MSFARRLSVALVLAIAVLGVTLGETQQFSQVAKDHPLLRRLQGWWRGIPGGTGSLTLYDLVGGFPGTLTNMAVGSASGWSGSTRPGGVGQLNFDGVDDIVNMGKPSGVTDQDQKTVCVWTNPIDYGGSSAGRIINKFDNTGWMLFYNGNGVQLNYDFSTTGGSWNVAGLFPLNTWTHICMSYDRTSTSNLPIFYVNGFNAGSVTVNTTPVGTASSDNNSTLYIGSNESFSRAFHGAMDDVRIWNRLLPGKEIWEVYTLSRLGDPGMLVFPGLRAVLFQAVSPGNSQFLLFFKPPRARP